MKIVKNLIAAALISVSLFLPTLVKAQESDDPSADVYEGRGYRVSLNQLADAGLTYEGCNPRGQCIELTNGKLSQTNNRLITTWTNGQIKYVVTRNPRNASQIILEIFNGKKRVSNLTLRKV